MSGSSSTTSKTASRTFLEGASCWLCLEEGPDDSGAPLVRDCSCRGHSGYAHLPCLIEYGESKSREIIERGISSVNDDIYTEKIFTQCPNCKQSFQGDIYYDLTKAQLSFIEREFKDFESWHLGAMMKRIFNLDGKKDADRIEGEEISAKILTLIEDDTGNSKPSVKFKSLAAAYQCIGRFYLSVSNDKSLKKAKYYYEKARDAWDGGDLESVNFVIAEIEAKKNGTSLPKTETLSCLRAGYKLLSQNIGEHAIDTIKVGVILARDLFEASHTIEAIRLLDKLLLTSRRVHGASHKQTKDAEYLWQRLSIRYVAIEEQLYQALRYEKDRNSYVVNGPVNSAGELRSADEEAVPSADITFTNSLPVVLHGLKKNAHLNGEIGDIRDLCPLISKRWVVHLEGKGLKPVKVKQENLRILFDLPDPKTKKELP